jgi:hypothetical protein
LGDDEVTDHSKCTLNSPDGTVELEGTEQFVVDRVAQLSDEDREIGSSANLDIALNHSWNWFSLHAEHRMQAVNYFLIASAFLSAAYVSALRYPPVAFGVASLGVVFCVCFYCLEIRIQELVKASEKALYPLQEQLARLTGIDALNICKNVETPKHPLTRYSLAIRTLCGVTGAAFAVGIVYAAFNGQLDASIFPLVYRGEIIVAALALLLISQKLLMPDQKSRNWIASIVGAILVGTAVLILVMSAIRAFR